MADTPKDTPMDVLVVIDVQNCFMFHGDKVAGDTSGLNTTEEASKDIVNELETLVDGKTHVVFSRDFHPVNHISLEGYEGRQIDYETIWPKHCRNKTLQCKSRVQTDPPSSPEPAVSQSEPVIPNKIVDTTTGEIVNDEKADNNKYLEVVGTELSYMFYRSEIFREPVKMLVLGNREGMNKIGLDDTMSELITENLKTIDKSDEEREINYGEPLTVGGKQYISLTKGERCDKEAYSAFNYHIQYKPTDPYIANGTPKEDITPDDAANSTGLWEWILNNRDGKNEITITVCGLVGNVCVMHSLLQGIALWNNVYSKLPKNEGVKVKFVYSLQGTRFAPVPPFAENVKPDFDTDNVVGHFNKKGLPDGMGIISMNTGIVSSSERVTSFEVLDYEGRVKPEKGEFEFTESKGTAAQIPGGRRRRRSVRRGRQGNKSRKMTKRVKGRRTYKNKRRNTKRRL
jgi:hypothetical protein